MPFPTILPGAPWKRRAPQEFHILDHSGKAIARVELRATSTEDALGPITDWPKMHQIAQAVVALPEILDAAHAAANALDVLFPGWTDADIREKETEAETIIDARRQLRAALRRANNLHADGTPAQPGEYP